METQRRKDTRLKSWNYAGDAWYFVTICCAGRAKLFGEAVDEDGVPLAQHPSPEDVAVGSCRILLSPEGESCAEALRCARVSRRQIHVVDFVVMPNHVHLIAEARQGKGRATDLGEFVHYVKSSATRSIRKRRPGITVWQKGYHEHVIRDEADYRRIAEYIADNPAKWVEDRYFA